MKSSFVQTSTHMPKAIYSDENPVNDYTRRCKRCYEKRSPPGDLRFETSAHPTAPRDTFSMHIRCIKKTACPVPMAAPPLLNAFRKNAVHFSAHPVKRNAKGSRKNNFTEFALRFGADWVDLKEHNRKRRQAYVEDCVSEDRPKMA